MNRIKMTVISFLVFVSAMLMQAAADPVIPATLTINLVRDTGGGGFASGVMYFKGDTIRLTNCVIYTGADTNSPVQDLTGVVIDIVLGNSQYTNNASATGNIQVAASGTFWAELTVPNQAGHPYLQISITNEASFTFPLDQIQAATKIE